MNYRVQLEFPFEGQPRTKEERLEQKLGELLDEPVVLHVTQNRRTMISATRRTDALHVRIHRMFLRAEAAIVHALAHYLKRGRSTKASRVLSGFIEKNREVLAPSDASRERVVTKGAVHNLSEIFDDINQRHFEGKVFGATITWGRRSSSRRRRRTIKLGTYSYDERLIRVHPALDQDFVPRFFVEYIVFHEILHHLIPVASGAGRRVVHSAEFRARERAYPHYVKALMWEARHVRDLMRAPPRV
ncbi:MAG: hypothetical protein IPK60_17100 [Sandaracinaceae bacterium]|nr:hypothetical protein [Sandaracinaceae bacterium]